MSPEITVIAPRRGWIGWDLHDLWEHREILWILATREIKVRYKQTFFGATWAIIQPLSTMIVFSIFFGRLAAIPSDGIPYPLFSFAALIPWTYFSHTLAGVSGSLVDYRHIISKVYFPRLLLPLAPLISNLADFAVSMVVLLALMAWYGFYPTAHILFIPALLLFVMLTAFSIGLWLATLNVHYRDFRYVVPFILQLWLFMSPIAYPSTLVPESWHLLYGLNPMAGIIEGFRSALLGTPMSQGLLVGVALGMDLLLLVTGLMFFRRVEQSIVDVM